MKVLELINEVEELVEKGNSVPFSSKALVNPEEIIEILDEIRTALPPELAEARKIVAERKQILFEAQADADRLKNDVEGKLRQVIDNSEITKNAQTQAEIIIENAQTQAKEIRIGTQHYSDKILYNLQIKLKEINDQIEANRKELKDIK
ncbi:MAG: hypothetical protein VB030_07940 [Eubacterium aggregans]|uniref:hypothetical protein n=1 Tax=Eubacterium TaxID=1730 RepID=UPI0023F31275|nr:hypothetical protein [Eubacterium aggregans]MDD4692105.1 hypothetical protein [Eubacterium aggregans]MEA5074088.1 hypothetical protein [Eubacterium aggregans]